MCLLCWEIQKEKMTYKEINKALWELLVTNDNLTDEEIEHYIELLNTIHFDKLDGKLKED